MKINGLPDYPAIKKLASALHRHDANHHGAAIMIGAGFSRSAAHHVSRSKRVPLWSDFTEKLARELYGPDERLNFVDPLRVAEEYRTYFGQSALDDRIRFEIDDAAWQTGPIYKSLLSLPWSDVLTTNWDTLLERAAKEVNSPYYTPVTKTADLAWAQSPRIVKLHGTIGVTDSFIAAQEDYRKYPERFAPFVNFTRQAFIENELCLLGFSGDDPNFLQWAGWVRDHLANHARKIYLVGALNLSAARRKQLESTNVAPIDLFPVVRHISDRDLRHQAATEQFLLELRNIDKLRVRAHEWRPSTLTRNVTDAKDHARVYNDADYGAKLLAEQLETMQRDRESYPGWLMCPPLYRTQLANQLSTPFPNPKNLAALAPDVREKVLYEIAWRHGVTFEYVRPWLADALFEVAHQEQHGGIGDRQRAEIALVLLNNIRVYTPEGEEEQRVIDEREAALIGVLEKHAFYLPDCAGEIAYHQALSARNKLDYAGLESIVEAVSGEDPVWKLRKAALLMELGRADDANKLLAEAYGILLENHRMDRQSISTMSRLLWAHWLLNAMLRGSAGDDQEALPQFVENQYRGWKCDPWVWIDTLRNLIDERRENALKRRNPIEPQFEQGHYREADSMSATDFDDFLLLEGISTVCGVPLRTEGRGFGVNLLASEAEKMVLHGGVSNELLDLTLLIRAAHSESSSALKEVFGRINVASYNQATVSTLVSRILSAVEYWQRERSRGRASGTTDLSRLRVLLEVLARLSVRASPERAKELFLLGVSLGRRREMQHLWLSDSLGSLLNVSLKSVPSSEQSSLLKSALDFPLESEVGARGVHKWPNPVIEHPGVRLTNLGITERISQLIDLVRDSQATAKCAPLTRLLPLVKEGYLNNDERLRLADAIWGADSSYSKLPETGFLAHALMIFPSRDPERVEELVRARLFQHDPDVLANTQGELRVMPSPEINTAISIYAGIANAAAQRRTRLFPTAEQAVSLFDSVVTWRPTAADDKLADFSRRTRRDLARSIGDALSYSIAVSLSEGMKTSDRLAKLTAFYSGVDGGTAVLPAMVYFTVENVELEATVARLLAASLRSRDSKDVGYATIAMSKWLDFRDAASSSEFARLVAIVISIIESARMIALQQLLWLARKLLKRGSLSDDQRAVLCEIVPNLYATTEYRNVEPWSREAVSASIIRAECIKLTRELVSHVEENQVMRDLIAKSSKDPLPEVRFALDRKAEDADS